MRNVNFPTISVIVATHNSARTIGLCLKSIHDQQYPREKIEIIVADGASTDNTKQIALPYGVRWIDIPLSRQNAEYNKATGIAAARHDIIAMIDHDNVLPHDTWLQHMVAPLVALTDVVGAETLRYHYDPSASILDRYFALFGAGDPLVWYMGKADRLSYIHDTYVLSGEASDCGAYYVVRFRPENMTTIGANGFLVRRHVLMKNASAQPGRYFDMDVNVDLIRKGFDRYAFVKDSILHLTGYGSVMQFLKRRLLFLTQYRFGKEAESTQKLRRYGRLSGKDKQRLFWAIIACATCIIPLYDSIRGWRKIKDSAWFLHPLLCASFVVIYGYAAMRHAVFVYGKKLLAK